MDDSAFGRLVERGYERSPVLPTRRGILFGEGAQMGDDAAIAQGTARTLAGAFGGGFGVGHEDLFLWTGRLADARKVVKVVGGIVNPVRGFCATAPVLA